MSDAPGARTAAALPRRDPRPYQIAVLGSLIVYGLWGLDFEIEPVLAAVILIACQLSQWGCGKLAGLPRFDPKSAIISSLSLVLLLRTQSLPLAALAAVLAIGSKFAIRVRGKHVFNPTNFGLAVTLLLTDRAWVSPGQWGAAAWLAFLLAGLGGLVVHRAARGDVTVAFLAAWSLLLFGRAAWLGDPLAIPLHQLQSGALLIFAFFMISDPKTLPDRRWGRILYAALVAAVAGWIQFGLHRPNGPLWALFLCAPLVPLLDALLPAVRYRWATRPHPAMNRRATNAPAEAGFGRWRGGGPVPTAERRLFERVRERVSRIGEEHRPSVANTPTLRKGASR